MIEAEKRKAIFLLHQEGLSQGEIARLMSVSRCAVRAIIEQQGRCPIPFAATRSLSTQSC